MNDLITSFVGNLHIVRRIGSGFIFYSIILLAVHLHARPLSDDQFLKFVSDNTLLASTFAILVAYLTGSLIEFIGTKIILYGASVLACTFQKPIEMFGWIQQPVRGIFCLLWWVFFGVYAVFYYAVALAGGWKRYSFSLESSLDQSARQRMSELRESVRFGLHHPGNVHYSHAIEDVFHKSGDRRPSLERVLNRDEDVSALVSGLIFGAVGYFIVRLVFGTAESDGLMGDELVAVILFYIIFLFTMLVAVMFLSFRRGMVISAVETMTSNLADDSGTAKTSGTVYQKRRYSKAGRYVAIAFLTIAIVGQTSQTVLWFANNSAEWIEIDEIELKPEGAEPEILPRAEPSKKKFSLFDDWIFPRFYWASLFGLCIFVFLAVFRPRHPRTGDKIDPITSVAAAGLFVLGYALSGLIVVIASDFIRSFSDSPELGNLMRSVRWGVQITAGAAAALAALRWRIGKLSSLNDVLALRTVAVAILVLAASKFVLSYLGWRVDDLLNQLGLSTLVISVAVFRRILELLGEHTGLILAIFLLSGSYSFWPRRRKFLLTSTGALLILFFVGNGLAGNFAGFSYAGLNLWTDSGFRIDLGYYLILPFQVLIVLRLVRTYLWNQMLSEPTDRN